MQHRYRKSYVFSSYLFLIHNIVDTCFIFNHIASELLTYIICCDSVNPRPTNLCPRQYGFFSMNDGDCSKYIMCQGGIATIMNCPAGLVFNSNKDTCDWQINVPECNPNGEQAYLYNFNKYKISILIYLILSVFKHFTCPEAPVDEYGYLSDVIYKYK